MGVITWFGFITSLVLFVFKMVAYESIPWRRVFVPLGIAFVLDLAIFAVIIGLLVNAPPMPARNGVDYSSNSEIPAFRKGD